MAIFLGFVILAILLIGALLILKNSIFKEINSLKDKVDERILSSQSTFFAAQESLNESLRNLHQDLGKISESSRSLLERVVLSKMF